jgi:hypothetical protein
MVTAKSAIIRENFYVSNGGGSQGLSATTGEEWYFDFLKKQEE